MRARGRLRRAVRRPRPRGLARQLARRGGRRALLLHRRARRAARPGRPLRRRRTRRSPSSARPAARCARESVFDYCRRELARLRVDAPELPFDFVGGFAGYLGFELKAECGGRVHADLAAARRRLRPVRPGDRLRPPRAPRSTCSRSTEAGGGEDADAWLAATGQRLRALAREPPPLPPAPAAPGTPALRAARPAGRLPGEHRRLPARDLRGRELRDLPDDGAAQRRARSTRCAAYRALRARNPAPFAALLRLGELSVLSSSPERFLRVDRDAGRRVAADEGHGGAAGRAVRGRLPRRRAAAGREDPRREPHDRRPRPQRPRPGLAARARSRSRG